MVDQVGLSLGPCHKPRIMQRFYRRGFQFLNVLGFFKYTKHLLQVGNSSQAFMFSAHETGIIITFPPSSAMSAMTLCILNISSGILCPGAALLLVSTKKSTATGGARMHSWPGREIFFVRRMLVRGENSVWQMGEYVFL